MKNICLFLLLILFCPKAKADLSPPLGSGVGNPQTNQTDIQAILATRLPDGTFPANIVERGQNHRRWERITTKTNGFGIKVLTNSWVELQTGMYRRNVDTGEWVESAPGIIITNNGAIAQGAPHQAHFSVNLNSPVGVEVQTPDNQLLKLHVLGIALYDFVKDSTVLIAELQDSDGQLVSTNQVLYTNAFTDFHADVRYTYSRSGIEQDIILRQRPPLPESLFENAFKVFRDEPA